MSDRADKVDAVDDTVDARVHHCPERAPELVRAAVARAGTQKEAAERLGVTAEYLRLLAHGQRQMSYTMQVALQALARS